MIEIVMEGMRLASRSNAREHWGKRHKREKAQCEELDLLHGSTLRKVKLPCTVTLYRHAPSQGLDGEDNLRAAFKAIKDYLATQLLPEATQANQHGRRGDDSDPRITWQYGQRRADWAVEIVIEGAIA